MWCILGESYICESLLTKEHDWFKGLDPQDFWLQQINGTAIDLDEALAGLAESDCGRIFLWKQDRMGEMATVSTQLYKLTKYGADRRHSHRYSWDALAKTSVQHLF